MSAVKKREVKKNKIAVPKEVVSASKELTDAGYQAYLVGGSVRSFLLGQPVKDWDIATDALPKEIIKLFPNSFYNNKFGTVGVKTESKEVIEVTTFRKESKYTDKRHPSEVTFTTSRDEDLKRRDFTVNALAIDLKYLADFNKKGSDFAKFTKSFNWGREIVKFEDSLDKKKENMGPGIEGDKKPLITIKRVPKLGRGDFPSLHLPVMTLSSSRKKEVREIVVDNFSGLEDLEKRLIRTVGDPKKRFNEDALRLLRAVRLAVVTGFKIEKNTAEAIQKNANLLKYISCERIQEELKKIILSPWPAEGIEMLRKLGLLEYVIPHLEEGVGVEQNWHHLYSVYQHAVLSLKFCFDDSLEIRLAALFHDIAKPRVKRTVKDGQSTFYFHEVEGEKITRKSLKYLRFPREVINETGMLVRYHMFNFDPEEHDDSTVRRLVYRVGGVKRMNKLITLRIADRLGSGCHQGDVFKLRKLRYLIEKVSHDPISLGQLKANGNDLIKDLKIKPGPNLGFLLKILLAEIIVDPKKNKKSELLKMSRELLEEERKSSGALKRKASKAKAFLRGRRKDYDLELKSKYGIRDVKPRRRSLKKEG